MGILFGHNALMTAQDFIGPQSLEFFTWDTNIYVTNLDPLAHLLIESASKPTTRGCPGKIAQVEATNTSSDNRILTLWKNLSLVKLLSGRVRNMTMFTEGLDVMYEENLQKSLMRIL